MYNNLMLFPRNVPFLHKALARHVHDLFRKDAPFLLPSAHFLANGHVAASFYLLVRTGITTFANANKCEKISMLLFKEDIRSVKYVGSLA